MGIGFRRSAIVFFGLLVLLNFNNCGVYESELGDANSFLRASLECEDEGDCVVKNNTNLKVFPFPSGSLAIAANVAGFDVGGECNEAGYASHHIVWRLVLRNMSVRDSGQFVRHGETVHAQCINGRFKSYVILSGITGVDGGVNRTGLSDGNGTRVSYELQFEIIGRDNNGVWYRNPNQGGMRTITLFPLDLQ